MRFVLISVAGLACISACAFKTTADLPGGQPDSSTFLVDATSSSSQRDSGSSSVLADGSVAVIPDANSVGTPDGATPPGDSGVSVADAGVPVVDSGTPATVTPPSAFPTVVNSGGVVVASPKVKPIFFTNYPQRPELERFHQAYARSSHWAGAVGEYGVGPMTLLPSVTRTDAAPSQLSDAQIQDWIRANLGEGQLLGAADPDTVYVLYFPETTTISLDSDQSCQSFGGYHNEVATFGGTTKVGYAVIPNCGDDELYLVADHEMVEWATDRYPFTAPAYQSLVPEFAAFGLFAGSENSDICTFLEGIQSNALGLSTSGYTPADLGFRVQRHFSNVASKAGHFPCAPNYNETFLVGIPQLTERANLGARGATKVMGTSNGAGEISVKIHSDKAVFEPWRIFATALSFSGGQARMKVTLDKSRVLPGDEIKLTISASRESQAGIMLITTAPDGTAAHSWPILVFDR